MANGIPPNKLPETLEENAMTLSDIGSLGEFLGFFAVLATLVYLSIQTRHAKQVAMGEAARAIVTDFINVWSALKKDDDLIRLMRIGVNDWKALNKNEKARVHSFFCELMLNFDAAMRQEHLEGFGDLIVGWENNLLGLLISPGGKVWWETCQYLFNSPVVERLNSRLGDPTTLPPSWPEGVSWIGTEDADFKWLARNRLQDGNAAPNESLKNDA